MGRISWAGWAAVLVAAVFGMLALVGQGFFNDRHATFHNALVLPAEVRIDGLLRAVVQPGADEQIDLGRSDAEYTARILNPLAADQTVIGDVVDITGTVKAGDSVTIEARSPTSEAVGWFVPVVTVAPEVGFSCDVSQVEPVKKRTRIVQSLGTVEPGAPARPLGYWRWRPGWMAELVCSNEAGPMAAWLEARAGLRADEGYGDAPRGIPFYQPSDPGGRVVITVLVGPEGEIDIKVMEAGSGAAPSPPADG